MPRIVASNSSSPGPRRLAPLVALALTLAAPACMMQREGNLMKADLRALRSQLEATKKGMDEDRAALQAALGAAEKKTAEVGEALEKLNTAAQRNDADFGVQMDKLAQALQEMTGKLEEVSFRLDRLEKKDKSAAEEGTAPTPVANDKVGIALPPESRLALPSERAAAQALVLKQLDNKSNDEGKRLAQEFVGKWSKDEGATDVVRLALGDRFAADKLYQKAVIEYKKVLDAFPKGSRADDAMFKIAQTFLLMGYHEDAKVFFEELVRRYPKSSLVKDAKAKLGEVEKAKKDKKPAKKGN